MPIGGEITTMGEKGAILTIMPLEIFVYAT
jgi:hypothetical protein